MKKIIIPIFALFFIGCKSTPDSSYLTQCKMKDSETYGQITPIPFGPAVKDGISGVVTANFTILEDGSISDIKIVESSPKRIFDRNTRKTLQQVECQPIIENGQAIKVVNQTITLNF